MKSVAMLQIRRLAALVLTGIACGLATAPTAAAQGGPTCSDFSNRAAAQRAANTRDADGDGLYCESLPCPCPGETAPPSPPAPSVTPPPTPPVPPAPTMQGTPPAPPATAPQPAGVHARRYFAGNDRRRIRPRTVSFGAHERIIRIRWRNWGGRVPVGRGTYPVNDCVPSCARGEITNFPVTVRLSRARTCADYIEYRTLTRVYVRRGPSGSPRRQAVSFPCS